MDNNLPELRDIHLPLTEISFFPLAYGWWLLVVALAVLAFLVWQIRRQLRKSKKRFALQLLEKEKGQASPVAAAVKMSELLRRICVYKYPRAAALYGREWVAFLNEHSREKLYGRTAGLLLDAPYIGSGGSRNYNAGDAENLYRFCRQWIGENL